LGPQGYHVTLPGTALPSHFRPLPVLALSISSWERSH
jgi:hypothetical protein